MAQKPLVIYAGHGYDIWLTRCCGNALRRHPTNATGIKRDDIQPVLVGENDMIFPPLRRDYDSVVLDAVPGYTCGTPVRNNTDFYCAETVCRLLL